MLCHILIFRDRPLTSNTAAPQSNQQDHYQIWHEPNKLHGKVLVERHRGGNSPLKPHDRFALTCARNKVLEMQYSVVHPRRKKIRRKFRLLTTRTLLGNSNFPSNERRRLFRILLTFSIITVMKHIMYVHVAEKLQIFICIPTRRWTSSHSSRRLPCKIQ